MSKPIQEQIFKSRLTITYRTNITGTVQQEKLPYRLLVLGEFAGRSVRQANLLPDLARRSVRSIKRGTTVNNHLNEVVPTWRIPPNDEALSALRSVIPGRVVFDKVTCTIPATALSRDEDKPFSLGGTARFESSAAENGMCDLHGELHVSGSLSTKIADRTVTTSGAKIDLVGAVTGTYVDPATNKVVGIVTGLLEVRGLEVEAARVSAKPADEGDEAAATGEESKVKVFTVSVEGEQHVQAERTIPITSLDSFSPDAIASSIPEVYRLRVLKRLLLDLQSQLRNRPELRKRMKDMLPGYGETKAKIEEKLQSFRDLKEWADESFPLLRIERGPQASGQGGGEKPGGDKGGGEKPGGA